MPASNQLSPGMTINIDKKIYRVESCVKISVTKGTPFIKTKLRDLITEEVIEKNFKQGQNVQEVSLVEHDLEAPHYGTFLLREIGAVLAHAGYFLHFLGVVIHLHRQPSVPPADCPLIFPVPFIILGKEDIPVFHG